MYIVMLGLNFKTAPVAIRELLAVSGEALAAALDRLSALEGVSEAVLLSTCNRTEIYAVGSSIEEITTNLTGFIADLGQIRDLNELGEHLYHAAGIEAADHLFRVASGLDSMVIGETQILGQVRDAYTGSVEAGAVGKVLHELFRRAIAVGRRVQTETGVGHNAVSVSYATVELAKKVFESLNGRRCMAIGAGETAKLTVRHLQASGVKQIVIANRTLDKAEELAQAIGGTAIAMDAIPAWLLQVDVVISSTSAPGYVLTQAQVVEAVRQRRGRPIFLFDIAVPRDMDPAIAKLEGAFLYDIDDLQGVVQANLQLRTEEAQKAAQIIKGENDLFRAWLATLEVVPTITLLRQKVELIRQEELGRLFGRLPDLTDRERGAVEAMSVTLINKILNDPTQQLKGMAGDGVANQAVETVVRLFNLSRMEEETAVKRRGDGV